MYLQVNLGCGLDIREGFVNLDCQKLPGVDVVADLGNCRTTPLPFEENSVDHFLGLHLIEHIEDTMALMQELYRCAKPEATAHFHLPYGSSDDAWEDPTHVRPYFLNSFAYFSQPAHWRSDYGYRGDWQVTKTVLVMDEGRFKNRPFPEIMAEVKALRNTVYELRVELKAIKPMREAKRELQTQAPVEILLVRAG